MCVGQTIDLLLDDDAIAGRLDEYGVDDFYAGPEVPRRVVDARRNILDADELSLLQSAVDPLADTDSYGIDLFIAAVNVVTNIISQR